MLDIPTPRKKTVRMLYLAAGHLSIALGFIGIFLPLIPSVPFLLLAMFCYERGSPELHRKLLENRYLGPHLARWQRRHAMVTRVKVALILIIAAGAGIAVYTSPYPWARIMIASIAASAAFYIATRRSR